MKRHRELPVVLAAGAALVSSRSALRWDGAPEDLVVAACWLAAACLWGWLVVVGSLHAWATRTGRARWRRLSGSLLPRAVRRQVEQLAMAGLLVVPVAACSAGADEATAPVLVLEDATPVAAGGGDDAPSTGPSAPTARLGAGSAPSTTSTPATTTTTTTPSTSTTSAAPAPPPTSAPSASAPPTTATVGEAPAPTAAPEPTAPVVEPDPVPAPLPEADRPDPVEDPAFVVPAPPGTHVVLRGENLWTIAEEHLASATDAIPDAVAVHRYWVALVEENRGALASGDPDVVYAGEVLRLPPVQP